MPGSLHGYAWAFVGGMRQSETGSGFVNRE